MTNLSALKPTQRIVDTVHTTLRAAILDGSLRPGQSLSVPELSRQLVVSRSPVREAVLALVADGLAVELPRRGVAVAEVDLADLLEIHEVREAVEAHAARLCAERACDHVFQSLGDVLERQRVAVERDDAKGWFETNAAFHGLIAEGSRNRRLSDVLMALQRQMRLGLHHVSSEQEQRRRGLSEHEAIFRAMESRETEKAESLMRAHIVYTRNMLARLQAEPPARKSNG